MGKILQVLSLLGYIFINPVVGWGQGIGSPPAQAFVVPPSPQAASLGRYGEIPVSLFTGTPSISLPLLQFGSPFGVKVPITLDYRATGIRMDDPGGWTGIGWALQTGGVIARTVHGRPDEESGHGYLSNASKMDSYYNNAYPPGSALHSFLDYAARGVWDLEPDVYSFSFPGGSGQFVLDHAGVPVLIPYQKIVVAPRDSAGVKGFLLTTEDGTQYVFMDPETTTVEPQGMDDPPFTVTSSWYLTRIEPVLGPAIKYDYTETDSGANGGSQLIVNETETLYYKTGESTSGYGQDLPPSRTYSQTTVITQTLTRMRTTNQQALFFSSERTDLAGALKLDSIRVENALGTTLKRFAFRYAPNNQPVASDERLKLYEVQEFGRTGSLPPHRFEYNPMSLPLVDGRNLAQDYWGYYNNNKAATLIPSIVVNQFGRDIFYLGADRKPVFDRTQASILTQVTYPTGGTTSFEYEPHDYGYKNAKALPLQIITTPRILKIRANATATPGSPIKLKDAITFRVAKEQIVRVQGFLDFSNPQYGNDTGSQAIVSFGCITCLKSKPIGRAWTEGDLPPPSPPGNGTTGPPAPVQNKTVAIGQYFQLVPGLYTMSIDLVDSSIVGVHAEIGLTLEDSVGTEARTITGGLRIRRTVARFGDGAPDIVREYRYQMEKAPGRSSGCVVSELPVFTYKFRSEAGLPGASIFGGPTVETTYTVASSNGLSQPGVTQGSPIGYREVTVLEGVNGNNGKTVTKFLSAADPGLAGGTVGQFPFAPNPKREYLFGKPWLVTTYRKADNDRFRPVQQTQTTYAYGVTVSPASTTKRVMGFKVGYTFNSRNDFIDEFKSDPYWYTSEWVHPAKSLERRYAPDDSTRYQETYTSYRYANPDHAQLTSRVVYAGPDTLITHYKYPLDYICPAGSVSPPVKGIQRLQVAHMLAAPIEQQQWRRMGRDSVLLSAAISEYNGIVVKRRLNLVASIPVKSAAATPSAVLPSGMFQMDARYQEASVVDRYNHDGEILQQHATNGPPVSYLWGYANTYPIAQVTNAAYRNTAYTSFEPSSPGRWAYDDAGANQIAGGRTGAWAYQLRGTTRVVRDSLDADNYDLICWTKGGIPELFINAIPAGSQLVQQEILAQVNGWQQRRFRLRIPANGAVALGAPAGTQIFIDEVRLHPVGAQMTSYTYDPLAGMTSQTDPSGRTITYEYDALGRLVRTRDEQGRVLSQQQYHYARRP